MITLRIVSGVYVRPWNISDFFMFYPFFHTCIGGLIFSRSSQTVETSGILSALQAGSVAFGFLLTSVKTLLAAA